ncbi:hypothetical protein CK203_069972 [Vitis vinifera]|uniref:Uncharacterized protein n=1 Tax=Vitis vinifera TaxID=29760 RepID=A0A438EPP0_VITVI|nr:hypothetical protein CK203_069972 [Vitis vinifera]
MEESTYRIHMDRQGVKFWVTVESMEMVQEERAMMGKNMTNGRLGRARLWRPSWFCSRKGSLSLFIGLSKFDPSSANSAALASVRSSSVIAVFNEIYPTPLTRYPLMEQAKKIIADHGSELPSLTRTMSRSNVAKGFWMVFIVRVEYTIEDDVAGCLLDLRDSRRKNPSLGRRSSREQ